MHFDWKHCNNSWIVGWLWSGTALLLKLFYGRFHYWLTHLKLLWEKKPHMEKHSGLIWSKFGWCKRNSTNHLIYLSEKGFRQCRGNQAAYRSGCMPTSQSGCLCGSPSCLTKLWGHCVPTAFEGAEQWRTPDRRFITAGYCLFAWTGPKEMVLRWKEKTGMREVLKRRISGADGIQIKIYTGRLATWLHLLIKACSLNTLAFYI